ncbi:MAG: SulP family inorganic anion transporter [Bryobacterales bacterium]|nr:SulP family inorganic anion transporter [Bryobacterales bacterium]
MPTSTTEKPTIGVLDPSSGNFFKYDGPAGTVVFLVALPLCLGIALASGAPLFAGIIAGSIGGIVIAALSGSQVSVSGPAAGLTVIVASAIQSLGSYKAFLTAVALGGLLQIVLGLLRLGIIADYVPNSVIRGMLAAIGLVIILKQIPHALGRDKDFEGDFAFFEKGQSNTLTDIVESVMSASPGAIVITLLSLAVLIFWDDLAKRAGKLMQFVPAPLVVVVLGIALNQGFAAFLPGFHLKDPEHMVALPVAQSAEQFLGQFMSPDLSVLGNQQVWIVAITLALVASLETLLSLEAADRLDPFKRISPPNRELFAQGVGNFLSGSIGGLPITSVVVRTSANVYAGARTWMSSFIHGVLLFGSALLIPSVLNLTPLACLAAILIVIGFKLTKPALYKLMYRSGWAQFLPFIITVLAIVFTDLLKGVVIGLVIGLFFVIRTNHHTAITVVNQDNYYLMRLNKDASFVNKSELRTKLRKIPVNSHLIIDGSKALYIDHDIHDVIEDFRKLAPYKNITLESKHL